MRNVSIRLVLALMCALFLASPIAAQERGELAVQYVAANSGEFDQTDSGVGLRFSWHLTPSIGLDAETSLFPSALGAPPFSSGRVEGLFGATVGPRIGNLRFFGKARAGFLRFQEASEPFGCIAIFPPPLACTLAAGATSLAFDLGGGVEINPGSRTTVRVDLSDRPVRYSGPAFDLSGNRRDSSFFSHDMRFSIGAGWRF